jgi:Tfp pilus assembly protein PilF
VEARVALAGIAEARGDSSRTEQILLQAAADAPQSPFPYWNLGLWDRNHDRPDDAKIQFAEAAKYLPNPAPAYEQLGEIALKAGDRTEAEAQTKRALSYDPDLVQAHVNLAAMYLNDSPAAQREAEIALSIDPNHASAWNILGIVAANNRQYDQAIADFRKALECDPDLSMARENLEKLGQH